MGELIIGLFSPFILMAFILIAFSMMVGVSPDTVLKPFFGVIGTVLRGLINLFILGIRLTLQGSGRGHLSLESFEIPGNHSGKHGSSSNDEPHIRIVQSDD